MISEDIFNLVRNEAGLYASWAIWSEVGNRAKSNMGDLSIFEGDRLKRNLVKLTNRFILVGLNISTIDIKIPLSNFHGENGEVYKVRYALKNTPLWGAYMTDVIKNFKEPSSMKMMQFLKKNPGFEEEHIRHLEIEMERIGSFRPTFIAFGNDVFEILSRHFHSVVRIPHYAARFNKDIYRERVLAAIGDIV